MTAQSAPSAPSHALPIAGAVVGVVTAGVLVAAAGAASGAAWVSLGLQALIVALVAAGGLWAGVIDARTRLLRNEIVYPLAGAVLLCTIALAIVTSDPLRLAMAVSIAVAGALLYSFGAFQGLLGWGDVKLALPIGMMTAWHGVPCAIVAFALAHLLAVPHAIVNTLRRRHDPEHRELGIPFGLYMVVAALIATVWFGLLSPR